MSAVNETACHSCGHEWDDPTASYAARAIARSEGAQRQRQIDTGRGGR